jgi:hypothetical protein
MVNKMNITQAQYTKVFDSDEKSSVKATIDGQEMFIPLDPANRHYKEILKQVADGDITIAAAD